MGSLRADRGGPLGAGLAARAFRDAAIGSYATTIANTAPEMAVQWAEMVGNTELRNSRIETIARTWLRADPAAARAWIAESTLPDRKKQQLLGAAARTR